MKALSFLVAAAITLSTASAAEALTISNVVITPIEHGVAVNWSTNEPADGEIMAYSDVFGIGHNHQDLLTGHQLSVSDELNFLPNSTYNVDVRSKNAQGDLATAGPFPFTTLPDTTPPVISEVIIDSATSTSAVIHIIANEYNGKAYVDYGPSESYGQTQEAQFTWQQADERNYRVVLNNLSPYTKYYLRIRADDGYGNEAIPVENWSISTDKLWRQYSYQSYPRLYYSTCVTAGNASGCTSNFNYVWPKEMSWTGNELLIYFNATEDDLNRGDLKFEVNVTYVAQDEGEWVELEVAGGNNPNNLSIIEPGLVLNQAKKYSVTFSPAVFSPGLNYLRLRGTTIGGTEIGYGNVAPVAAWNKMELMFVGPPLTDLQLLDKTEAQAARYFWDRALSNGFVRNGEFSADSSIAATGFGLASLAVMAERYGSSGEWTITPAQAETRALQILNNAVNYQGLQTGNPALYGKAGFLYHFITENGQRSGASEVSTVDMALLTAGALTAGQYFGGEAQTKANLLFNNLNWNYFFDSNNKLFYLGWNPNQDTEHFNIPAPDGNGYLSSKKINETVQPAQWDQPSDETILINMLALAKEPSNQNFKDSLYAWPRQTRCYGEHCLVNSWFGSLFTYIYGEIFFDFKAMGNDNPPQDALGSPMQPINWFENAKEAALANRQFVIDKAAECATFSENQWGHSASYAPDNITYLDTSGAKPATAYNGEPYYNHCVIPPYASIGTMPLLRTTSNESLTDNLGFSALRNFYDNHYDGLWGTTYGPHDSLFTSDDGNTDYSNTYLGIDLGPEVLMIENYRSGLINKYFMSHPKVTQAVRIQFPNVDSDNDGFSDNLELYLGTDPNDACPDNLTDPAWPPDFNNNQVSNIIDVLYFGDKINKKVADDPSLSRYDFNMDGTINIIDVLYMGPYMSKRCS